MKTAGYKNSKNNRTISGIVFLAIVSVFILTSSCGIFSSLNSNTSIKPNDSFILGNNEHGTFKVQLKNVSQNEIELYKAPISGGRHSRTKVQPNENVFLKVERNSALIIENKSSDYASVDLKVTGDTGLSMGYKN